jgi:hypothetical protein
VDCYRIALPNGRTAALSADQLRRISRGLGDLVDGHGARVVDALQALPEAQRADALAVVQLRFGAKQDVESISHDTGLSPWLVWQLEEAFLRALAEARASERVTQAGLLTGAAPQLSPAS